MTQLASPRRKSLLWRAGAFGVVFFLLEGIAWLVVVAAAAACLGTG